MFGRSLLPCRKLSLRCDNSRGFQSRTIHKERLDELIKPIQDEDEKMKMLRSSVFNAPMSKLFGLSLHFNNERNAVVHLPYNPNLVNLSGTIHGGAFMSLLDIAAWYTAAAHRKEAGWIATGNLSVNFLHAPKETDVYAIGNVLKSGKRQSVVEASIFAPDGTLCCHGVGTFIGLPPKDKSET
eukprot:TRINITY_DN8399_c0_g1_i4.p1 TRINITY_DN8399_c0_g1~~TRINITY_DN8399_c0_g1_i4.p1  ORF type:complete len:183 (-),score=26.00 TRINITY_DN8399_c0_g1_i4:56-604(-)